MAQVKFLKAVDDSAGWKEMEGTDDLTINSFTGSGAGLTNLDVGNVTSGTLDKAFTDPTMAGLGISYNSGELSAHIQGFQGIGVDSTGMYVDYDGTTIGINAGKLAVIGAYTTSGFSTINFIAVDDISATGPADTLNLVAGTGIAFATDALTKTITIESSGGSGGTYIAGDGLVENPAGTFNIRYDSLNTWSNTVAIANFTGTKLEITGTVGDVDNPLISILDNTLNLSFQVDQYGAMVTGDINAQGNVTFGVDATSTFSFVGLINTNVSPDVSTTRNLGDGTHRWNVLYVDSIIGVSKSVSIDNLVDKTSAESISGEWSFTGNVNIGNATTDTLTITSLIDSSVSPDASTSRDLGDGTHRWNDLYVDGIVDTNGATVATTRLQAIPDVGSSRPTASSSVRGHIYTTSGGLGVADVTEICLKDATDTYIWVQIATG